MKDHVPKICRVPLTQFSPKPTVLRFEPRLMNLLCTWSRTAVKYVMAWPNIQHDDRQQAGQVHAVVIVAAHIRVSLGCFQPQVGGTRRESPDVER